MALKKATATSMSRDNFARFYKNMVSQGEVNLAGPSSIAQANCPWESWEFDEEFFGALSRWTLANPETTLDRVIDVIQVGLENSKDLFSLIPESSFPAHALVTALAHVLQLGISARHAQRDAYAFVKDVVLWIGLVRSAHDSTKHRISVRQVWQNLRHMRNLVDTLCSWAVKILNDARWLRISHGLMARKEILEFNERTINARTLFKDLSAIRITGLEVMLRSSRGIIAEIKAIRKTQQQQTDRKVDKLEMRQQVAERERFFAETLDSHTLITPTYEKEGKRPCDEGTRVEILEEIRKWRNDIGRGSQNFLWLSGYPGCGKSAVAASFARECEDEGVLWAQFFVNRNNVETTDPRSYFPSIARQLAGYSPQVAHIIHAALFRERSLADDISDEQAARLFKILIRKASTLDPDRPVVVVIDGLDETHRSRLEETAMVFSTLFATLEIYSNVKVFISSRVENEILEWFTIPSNDKHVKRIHLDIADPLSIREVSRYIRRNLLDLCKAHGLNWDVWPGDEGSQALGDRASGLFIWAVAAIKFIKEDLDLHGVESPGEVLNALKANVLHDVSALYTLALTLPQDDWELETFRRIVGAIACLQEPLSLDDLAILLDLRKSPSSPPMDIVHFVRQFRTVLASGTGIIDGSTIPRIHKSFYEYIKTSSIDAQMHINFKEAHLELALQCLGASSHFGVVQEGFNKEVLPRQFRSACQSWSSHYSQVTFLGCQPLCVDHRTSLLTPLCSLFTQTEHSSSSHPRRKSIRLHYSAYTEQVHMYVDIYNHFGVWDAISGSSITHIGHIRDMIPSPNGKDIVTCAEDGTIRVWNSTNMKFRHALAKHSSALCSIAISPDGKSVVSASNDRMVCLWNYLTGESIWGSYLPINHDPTVIVFSCDGTMVITGWKDGDLRLLDAQTGKVVGNRWDGHKARITSISFSSSDIKVCSVDADGSCSIWDARAGHKTSSWTCGDGHEMHLKCTFSPKDDNVVVVYGDFGIEIRSYNERWITSSRNTYCLAFSPNGKEIIFGDDSAFSVAEIGDDGQITRIIRYGDTTLSPTDSIMVFSPSWDFVYFHQPEDNRLGVLALHHNKTSLMALPIQEAYIFDKGQPMPDMSETRLLHSLNTNNERLNALQWYRFTDRAAVGVELCMVMDNAVVAGYQNGSVTVWV